MSNLDGRLADGIIVKMRANGFVCYLPRFGFKAPVFLENQEKNVTVPRGMLEDGLLPSAAIEQRIGGTLEYDSDRETITVTTADGSVLNFTLFAHVRVAVRIEPSPYRLPEFRLDLLGLIEGQVAEEPGATPRKAIISDVMANQETFALLDRNIAAELGRYSQTPDMKSVYEQILSLEQHSLLSTS